MAHKALMGICDHWTQAEGVASAGMSRSDLKEGL